MPAHNASQILLAYHFLLQSPWQVVRPHREHFPEVEGVRQKQRGCQLPRFESFEWEFTVSETTRNLHTENWLHHLQRGGIEIQASMQDNGRETIQNLSTCSMSWYVMIQHGNKKRQNKNCKLTQNHSKSKAEVSPMSSPRPRPWPETALCHLSRQRPESRFGKIC